MHETTQGIYDALLQGRFAFDFVHEDRLEPERLAKYRALLLPNVAMLSDRQCQQLRDYVHSGGSLMASFETSLYDEDLKPRADFGLADLMGVSKNGDVVGTNGNPYSARIEAARPAAPDPARLSRHHLARRRAEPYPAQACRRPAAHRRSGLCPLSSGVGLSGASAHHLSRLSFCASPEPAACLVSGRP